MKPVPLRAGRLAASAATVALSAALAGCPADSDVSSGSEITGAALRFADQPLRPPTVIAPGNPGTSTGPTVPGNTTTPVPMPPTGPGTGPGSSPTPTGEVPVVNGITAPLGGDVLSRLQTRFQGQDDADFWTCFVFAPRTAAYAYNFVGTIGVTIQLDLDDDEAEPIVQTYVTTVTAPETVLLAFTEVDQAEELSGIVVTGTGPTASLRMNSSSWGQLDCTIINSGDEV